MLLNTPGWLLVDNHLANPVRMLVAYRVDLAVDGLSYHHRGK